jgi:hypothetical protein
MSYGGFRQSNQYRSVGSEYIVPSDSATSFNLKGVKYLQCTGTEGVIVVRHTGGALSKPIPLVHNESWGVGADMENVQLTLTTATDLLAYRG